MEIIGIGVDLQKILPFQEHLKNHNKQFFSRVFTMEEINYSQSKKYPAQHFAARFCAKEAAVKAISSREDMLITQFEVRSDHGKPSLVIIDTQKQSASFLAQVKFMVTLSHTDQYAVAQVLAFLE